MFSNMQPEVQGFHLACLAQQSTLDQQNFTSRQLEMYLVVVVTEAVYFRHVPTLIWEEYQPLIILL